MRRNDPRTPRNLGPYYATRREEGREEMRSNEQDPAGLEMWRNDPRHWVGPEEDDSVEEPNRRVREYGREQALAYRRHDEDAYHRQNINRRGQARGHPHGANPSWNPPGPRGERGRGKETSDHRGEKGPYTSGAQRGGPRQRRSINNEELLPSLRQQARNNNYYQGAKPKPCRKGLQDHPLYLYKSHSAKQLQNYLEEVNNWVLHWKRAGCTDEVEACVLDYITFVSTWNEDCKQEVQEKIAEVLQKAFPDRRYERFECLVERMAHEQGKNYLFLPVNRRLKTHPDTLFHPAWRYYTGGSEESNRWTIYLREKEEEATEVATQEEGKAEEEEEKKNEQEEKEKEKEKEKVDDVRENVEGGTETTLFKPKAKSDAIIINCCSADETLEEVIASRGFDRSRVQFILKKGFPIERYVFFGRSGFFKAVTDLSRILPYEDWGERLWILQNFVDNTFVRQEALGNVTSEADSDKFQCHMNLLNRMALPIAMNLRRSELDHPKYIFMGWHQLRINEDVVAFETRFPIPKWFDNLNDLFFDPTLQIDMNIQHIFDTNRRRVIEAFQSSQGPEKSGRWRKGPQHGLTPAEEDYREAQDWFMEEIRRQLLSAKYNYRLTIPQFYKGRVQLLLPLCLQGEPVLAATLSKESEHLEPSPKGDRETKFVYKLSTVLRISWAYNNARLLGRIESNWLIPELANKEPGHDLVDASGEDYSS